MNVLKKAYERIRHWLMGCLDMADGEKYRIAIRDNARLARETKSILGAVTVLHVNIPATTAVWYEDAVFSEKLWGALKEKYVSITERGDNKVATLIILNSECSNDIS